MSSHYSLELFSPSGGFAKFLATCVGETSAFFSATPAAPSPYLISSQTDHVGTTTSFHFVMWTVLAFDRFNIPHIGMWSAGSKR